VIGEGHLQAEANSERFVFHLWMNKALQSQTDEPNGLTDVVADQRHVPRALGYSYFEPRLVRGIVS
jgi:hypothetical protein